MKLQFCSIGKNHEPYIKPAIDEFTGRLANYFPVRWNLIPPPKNAGSLTEQLLKKKEAELVMSSLRKDDYLIILDERGKQFTSYDLSIFIQDRANEGNKNVIFLIGGAYGSDESLLKRANYTWSLSLLTFPHQLVRLILCEQVYRACTILRNEKYHHT